MKMDKQEMTDELEAEADRILREYAIDIGASARQLGIIDERRARTIREREITMSSIESRKGRIE